MISPPFFHNLPFANKRELTLYRDAKSLAVNGCRSGGVGGGRAGGL